MGAGLIATPHRTFFHVPGRWQSVLPKLISYGSSLCVHRYVLGCSTVQPRPFTYPRICRDVNTPSDKYSSSTDRSAYQICLWQYWMRVTTTVTPCRLIRPVWSIYCSQAPHPRATGVATTHTPLQPAPRKCRALRLPITTRAEGFGAACDK